ncbi:hypothetical protein CRUP_013975, partial [Coryphaenoides rupestris]
MQCALHQLGGHGVSDRPSGRCQGDIRDTGRGHAPDRHGGALQGVGARHHSDRQPEEAVFPSPLPEQQRYILRHRPTGQKVEQIGRRLSQVLRLRGAEAGQHHGQRQPPVCRDGPRAAGQRHRQLRAEDDCGAEAMSAAAGKKKLNEPWRLF